MANVLFPSTMKFKGWNKYGFYKNIVNENMKMQLLHLYKANEFLKFKEIEINGTSVTNG